MKWNPHCDCGQEKSYNKKWDAYYCDKCNVWLEPCCKDPECEFCKHRPEKPQKIKKESLDRKNNSK